MERTTLEQSRQTVDHADEGAQVPEAPRSAAVSPSGSPAPEGRSGGTPQPVLRDTVRVTLPAAGAYLSVLRTATAALASRLDFTLDDIEDLRIAVDEACALLVASAVPGTDVTAEFELQTGLLQVCVSALTLDGQQPPRDTFAWTVLTALAGEVDSSANSDNRVMLRLRKAATARVEVQHP